MVVYKINLECFRHTIFSFSFSNSVKDFLPVNSNFQRTCISPFKGLATRLKSRLVKINRDFEKLFYFSETLIFLEIHGT